MNRLRFGLIGCGRILRKHAEALIGVLKEKAELAAVCDIKAERAKAGGETYGVPYFTNFIDENQ